MQLKLLMVITPPDAGIAAYTLTALRRRMKRLPDCALRVYLNGLSEEQERSIIKQMKGAGHIEIKSNGAWFDKDAVVIGKLFETHYGTREMRQGKYEAPAEVWSRELVLLEAPLVGIIDADFELFDSSLLRAMISAFAADDRLAFCSTEHNPTIKVFETYAQEECMLMERWHTCLCVYRRAALEQCQDFTYREERNGQLGLPMKYDHSAWLTKQLLDANWRGTTVSEDRTWQFLHYGAFAKNKTLAGARLAFYRFFRILMHNGYRHLYRVGWPALLLKRIGSLAYRMLRFDRFDQQRSRYIFDQE
jgi:hypothetical protein